MIQCGRRKNKERGTRAALQGFWSVSVAFAGSGVGLHAILDCHGPSTDPLECGLVYLCRNAESAQGSRSNCLAEKTVVAGLRSPGICHIFSIQFSGRVAAV